MAGRGEQRRPSMKKILLLILALFVLLACSEEKIEELVEEDTEEFEGLGKAPPFKVYLLEGLWKGTKIDMTGLGASTSNWLGYEPLMTFDNKGNCLIQMGQDSYESKWKLKDGYLEVTGPGIDSKVYYDWSPWDKYYWLHFYDLKNYSIVFFREDYLEEKDRAMQERIDKKEEELAAYRDKISGLYDISQMGDGFLSYLKDEGFEDFEHVDLDDDSSQEIIDGFLPDLLALGLDKRNWYHVQDNVDPILDAYEIYVFNASFSPEEREARHGEEVGLDYEEIRDYIEARLTLRRELWDDSNRALYFTGDVFKETERYGGGDYIMVIDKEEPPVVKADLLNFWRKDGVFIFHLLYDDGHGWYVLEELEGQDHFKFIRGSFTGLD